MNKLLSLAVLAAFLFSNRKKISQIKNGFFSMETVSYTKETGEIMPRGIRNNNAGNIRYTGDNWQGMSGKDDSGFIIFEDSFYGLRALAKLLTNYKKMYGLTTVNEIISRWAPENENNTNAYADFIAQKLGVSKHQPLDFNMQLPDLMKWLVYYENGMQPYTNDEFIRAIQAV